MQEGLWVDKSFFPNMLGQWFSPFLIHNPLIQFLVLTPKVIT